MRLEDMRYDFPKMPKEMRDMIEREVQNQVKAQQPQFRSAKRRAGRTVAASLAAVMLCGTTVFAGVGIYRMQQQKTGEHGVEVSISGGGSSDVIKTQESLTIPNVKLEVGYLPEGMVQTEQGKYSFEDNLNKGGVSMAFFRMNTGDDKFQVQQEDVVSSEDISVNGHDGVYLQYPHLNEEEISFNQRIYVAYTDVHYVMEMYVASDVSKEEALKIAESVKLVPAKDLADEGIVVAQDWSDYQESEKQSMQEEGEMDTARMSVPVEEMKNTRQIGERFAMEEKGLAVKVSDVKISDDLSLLDPALLDEDFRNEADENGRLRPATIQYVKEGGKDSLSEVVKSREVAKKLVYATVEYTNTGKEELSDVMFFGNLMRMSEAQGEMQIRTEYEKPAKGEQWDKAVVQGFADFWEMPYYDVHGGERGNNYISSIKPGETATVHMAWIVTEEELGLLYLDLNTCGGYEFNDNSLKTGYVDIRR